jgi:hypothetical protein
MHLKSLLLFGITSTIMFTSFGVATGSAEANGYQGPICITGRAKGNVTIRWGNWSRKFNATEVREQSAINGGEPVIIQSPSDPAVHLESVPKVGAKIFAEADKNVARMQPYNIELNYNGGNTKIFVSDKTAKIRKGSCGGPFVTKM